MNVKKGDALVIINAQNDFMQHGVLSVEGAEQIITPLNNTLKVFSWFELPVIAVREQHPIDHNSFENTPPHAIEESEGGEIIKELDLPKTTHYIDTGTETDTETQSAFEDTEIDGLFEELGIERIFVAGIDADGAILHTIKDAQDNGLNVVVLIDAVAFSNANEVLNSLMKLGVTIERVSPV